MQLESLPNELLLDLFAYFDAVQLLRTFYTLNSRFDTLLLRHFQTYHLDFRSISKRSFNIFCQDYYPLIRHRITSIKLSNDDETPNLTDLFLSHNITFNHLQSLSLYNIHNFDQLNQIIFQCSHLTRLNISQCYTQSNPYAYFHFMNNVWNLARLTHLKFDYPVFNGISLTGLTSISSSIEYLYLKNITCDSDCLANLFQCTPSLRYLCAVSRPFDYEMESEYDINVSSLTSFKLQIHNSIEPVKHLFPKLFYLSRLTIETIDFHMNGHEWEKIFDDHLPNLELFRLKMNIKFAREETIEDEVDHLVDSFRTPFWIEEYQWFIRCHWSLIGKRCTGILYTLPYTCSEEFFYTNFQFKSTCPNDEDYWSYHRVKSLHYDYPKHLLPNNCELLPFQFPNLSHLQISELFNDTLWSLIPSFEQLESLDFILHRGDLSYDRLQMLLNKAPRLHSIRSFFPVDLQMTVFQLTSSSIRQLDFLDIIFPQIRFFSNTDCIALANSSLGRQCEVLLIRLKNRRDILTLIYSMANLRSLTFRCRDDIWTTDKSSSDNDELVQWLQQDLLSTCTVIRDQKKTCRVHIWIR